MTAAEQLAAEVIRRCLDAGIREFVVCAGSRNSPLVLALLSAHSGSGETEVRLWPFFEERSAAFFAMGRSRATRKPVAVVTTSGTAAAELLPAVIESHYLGVPLLCITADRPRTFRGTGAPQAIEQAGLFGVYARNEWDVDDADTVRLQDWDQVGPAHLNVAFGEPLLTAPPERSWKVEEGREWDVAEATLRTQQPALARPLNRDGLLVLLGSLEGRNLDAVRQFLIQLSCPILADATSGLRTDPVLAGMTLRAGERALREWKPRRVLRIGGVPSGRFWRDLESMPEVEVISVLHGGFSGAARPSILADCLAELQPAGKPDLTILSLDRALAARLDHALHAHPEAEPGMIRHLSRWIPRGALVFLGNSLPIRQWNLAAAWEERGHRLFANRGANGIDGNLSTFLGQAADEEEAWAVVGDLTALYDLSAPWVLNHLTAKRIRIVIVNNGGGRIFSRLPVLGSLEMNLRQVTENHHSLRFEHWAAMWGFDYIRMEGDAIPALGANRLIIEMLPDEEAWQRFDQELDHA